MEELKKKLQDEIAALEYELRNELPKEILKARAHGDLSENAEYHAAKERQAFVNARLGQVQARLREFSMIDHGKLAQPGLHLTQARIHEGLPLFGGVVFRVFAQIAVRPCFQDFLGQLVTQFIFEGRDLVLKFLLELFHVRLLLLYGTLCEGKEADKAARST